MTAGLLGLTAALVAYIYIPRSLPPQPDSFMLIAHQSNLYLFSGEEQYAQLKQEIPDVQRLFSSRREVKDCIPDYLKMLISGQLPDICSRYALGLPICYLNYVPGWPGFFLSKARQANLQIYVLEVDTLDGWEKIQQVPLDGIVTNRVEVIGPLLK